MTLLFTTGLKGQVVSASLQASGLTCALCAKSIHQGLSSLYFVDSVDVDLESSSFELKFKKEKAVDPGAIKRKVEDAGFFIANLKLSALKGNSALKSGEHLMLSGSDYHITDSKTIQNNELVSIELIDEGFVGAKQYKKYLSASKFDCFKNNSAALKSVKDGNLASTQEFHVLIK